MFVFSLKVVWKLTCDGAEDTRRFLSKHFPPKIEHCFSGLQMLTQIIIADITTLKWRGLVSSMVSLPFIVNGFVGPNISAAVIDNLGWRWGCTACS